MTAMSPELLAWFCAWVAFDCGDAEPMCELIRLGVPIPEGFMRDQVAEIVSGKKVLNLKSAAQRARHDGIPAAEIAVIGLDLIDITEGAAWERRALDSGELAQKYAEGPDARKKAVKFYMDEYGVAEQTIENLVSKVRAHKDLLLQRTVAK